MFERFTERARQVVVLAQEEARTLKHNYIGTEHILLGLLREEEGLAARVLPFGWHVQLQLDGRDLPQHERRLTDLPGNLVFDHNGKFLEPVPPDHASFRILLDLVQKGRTWVKLSAPYEVSKRGRVASSTEIALLRSPRGPSVSSKGR